MLPLHDRFEVVRRVRPVDLVAPGSGGEQWVAPYAAVTARRTGAGPARLALRSGGTAVVASSDGGRAWLEVTAGGSTTRHRSRRHGRDDGPGDPGDPGDPGGPGGLALTLTATHAVAWVPDGDRWSARGRVDLRERVDVHDEAWLAGLGADADGSVADVRSGRFGQLGLRDLRLVTHADGSPYVVDGRPLLSVTSAGPGHFTTGHASVWALDLTTLDLEHRADLFFRRPGRSGRAGIHGDHAVHLLRDGDRWLVAASTWGDFDRALPGAAVRATLAAATDDLTTGCHVLDAAPLDLPTTGLRSVGVWDPHLVRTDAGWLAGYVSASRYFRFHPVVAEGPDLGRLRLRAATPDRRATEGTTLARDGSDWRVLASDGRDGRRGQRARYPVLDLDLRELGTLDAPYPSNLPWPTLVPDGDRWVLVGFDGRRYGGPLLPYGSHGGVVLSRTAPSR